MHSPRLMGILNITPDSYFDGGRYDQLEAAVSQAVKMAEEGATIIDIGGESTRPFSDPVSEEEELARVLPVIEEVRRILPSITISIDTVKPAVARRAIYAGANMLNDVNGCRDPEMRRVAVESGLPICVMHMLGVPKTMQAEIHYPGPMLQCVIDFLRNQTALLIEEGVSPENIIIDPGFGFGKTIDHNFEILQNLQEFKDMGFPVLLGLSRKSSIQRTLNKTAEECLFGTIALNTVGVLNGADILRVHDVGPHMDLLKVLAAVKGQPRHKEVQ